MVSVVCTFAKMSANARNINSIITMYGNTKVTPAVHGCYGSFKFYQWLHFDYHRETS